MRFWVHRRPSDRARRRNIGSGYLSATFGGPAPVIMGIKPPPAVDAYPWLVNRRAIMLKRLLRM